MNHCHRAVLEGGAPSSIELRRPSDNPCSTRRRESAKPRPFACTISREDFSRWRNSSICWLTGQKKLKELLRTRIDSVKNIEI
jgi:hypothetical protein